MTASLQDTHEFINGWALIFIVTDRTPVYRRKFTKMLEEVKQYSNAEIKYALDKITGHLIDFRVYLMRKSRGQN